MALTPDQKKRIAALDAKPADTQGEVQSGFATTINRIKARLFTVRTTASKSGAVKFLLLLLIAGIAAYFFFANQLHMIDYRKVLSSPGGNPVKRLRQAIQEQRQMVVMLQKGSALVLEGDYKGALSTAQAVKKMSPKNRRAQALLRLAADATVQKATREFESGEIEAALANTRLALKYMPDHPAANNLALDIASRLLHEAEIHFEKREYQKAIAKTLEIRDINPADMNAMNLLMRIKGELLTKADEFYISNRYFDALEMVQLASRIDPNDVRALHLMRRISDYVEQPKVELIDVSKRRNTPYARIRLPEENRVKTVKKGDVFKNLRVIDIDIEARAVTLLQIHTHDKFIIRQFREE